MGQMENKLLRYDRSAKQFSKLIYPGVTLLSHGKVESKAITKLVG